MFGFKRNSGQRSPSAAIFRALESDGLPPGIGAASELGVVESRENYSGRKVTVFRVFDRARAAERGLKVDAFGDLDAHLDLVLRSGHVEKDGSVVVTWRAPSPDAQTPTRALADRAMHTDDRFIHPGRYRVEAES